MSAIAPVQNVSYVAGPYHHHPYPPPPQKVHLHVIISRAWKSLYN